MISPFPSFGVYSNLQGYNSVFDFPKANYSYPFLRYNKMFVIQRIYQVQI